VQIVGWTLDFTRKLSHYLEFLSLYIAGFVRENCNFRTPNNALRYFRTPIVDFAKMTLEMLALRYT
ncbi:hypothetical protein Q6249_28825, partial [Klebsiella pneumoniae]|uniref:hypothetical protein n=1 Tax=Klebsiella pneumoniae TaxID=573 RepID=UPI0027310B2F